MKKLVVLVFLIVVVSIGMFISCECNRSSGSYDSSKDKTDINTIKRTPINTNNSKGD